MLENEIKKLTAAVEALTAAIQSQGVKPSAPAPADEPITSMPAIAPEDIERESPNPAATPGQDSSTGTVTRDELRDMCLSIVRADRSKKARVAGAIEKFGGKLLKDVPDDKLVALKAALESLK